MALALTRGFRETVGVNARRDAAYRRELLREALEQLVNGDVETGRGILGTYINATIGYPAMGAKLGETEKLDAHAGTVRKPARRQSVRDCPHPEQS